MWFFQNYHPFHRYLQQQINNKTVPVGTVWKLLPWNKGRSPTCSVDVVYLDNDFRIVKDIDGELFVYTRPVVPRDLGVVEE